MYDDENGFTAGDDSGLEVIAECYFATQEMVDTALEILRGQTYRPFEAMAAGIDPAAELGDAVTVNGVYAPLIRRTDSGYGYPDIEAPGEEELEDDDQCEGYLAREVKRKVTLGANYHGASITRANGIEVTQYEADGTPKSRAKLNGDVFAMYDDSGTARIYFDPETGRYKFVGDLDISGGSINMSGGSIQWGENNPAKDKLDKDDLPGYIQKTYIDETKIYSPSIYGGNLYATADSDFYARMTANAFELMREGSDTARAQLRAYTNLVELVLGVGSDEGGENGRLYLQKGVGSVNGSDDQNVAYLNYKDTDGNDSFIGFSDRDGMFLTASKISLAGTVDFSNATVIGLGAASGDTLAGTDCTIEADDDVTITAGDDVIITAGPVAIRVDAGNERVNFWFGDSEVGYILDADGLNPA